VPAQNECVRPMVINSFLENSIYNRNTNTVQNKIKKKKKEKENPTCTVVLVNEAIIVLLL
jgi:hypothetical protein